MKLTVKGFQPYSTNGKEDKMENLKVCIQGLTYARSDLFKVTGHLEEALEASSASSKGSIGTKKGTLEGALYRSIELQEEIIQLLLKLEATATEK